MNDYPQVVKDIHNEFLTAGDNLLNQAKEFLQTDQERDINKADLMENFGFYNAKQIKNLKQVKNDVAKNKELFRLINEYRRTYPNNKFISNRDVKRINEKYKLVQGSTDQYTGFVPAKNLKYIDTFFKSHKVEKRFHIQEIKYSFVASKQSVSEFKDYLKNIGNEVVAMDLSKAEHYIKYKIADELGLSKLWVDSVSLIERPIFEICAPKSDMIHKKDLFEKLGLSATKFTEVPDPIILYPVSKGYIIVTAWGDEASDPLVLNEQNN